MLNLTINAIFLLAAIYQLRTNMLTKLEGNWKAFFRFFFILNFFHKCVSLRDCCVFLFIKMEPYGKKLSIFFWIECNLLNIKSFFAPQITQDVVIITKNEFLRSSNSNYYICYYMEKNGSHWWGGMIFFSQYMYI